MPERSYQASHRWRVLYIHRDAAATTAPSVAAAWQPGQEGSAGHTAAILMVAVPIGLWALCVGVPYIAFNTTLGRSRW